MRVPIMIVLLGLPPAGAPERRWPTNRKDRG
jgi:hypothetical protein